VAPEVSVLLPVRDAAGGLGACLDSLLGQTLATHEVVAVDDGSRDHSLALLLERSRQDPRLRVLATPARGLVPALNAALSLARAELVARMDADDVAHPERLARQAERLRRDPGTDVLGCRVALDSLGEGPAGAGMRAYLAWSNGLIRHDEIVRDLLVESPLVHPSVMMRRRALRRLGGYRGFDGPEDYDLWLRARDAGLRFAKLPEPLLRWRDWPGRLTRRDPRYSPARFLELKLEALARGPLAHGRPVVLWGGGPIAKSWSRALRGRGHRVAAFVDVHPRRLGQALHGAPVVPWTDAARWPAALHLAAVGQPGARSRIRALAARLGLRDGEDLLAVA
jgi:glycosyltransferase involved in cell wall biosynthesis